MKPSLNTVLLYVNNPKASAEFYKKLGFKIGKPQHAMIQAKLGKFAFTLLNQAQAEFQQDTAREKGAGVFFHIKVDKIDRRFAELVKKGLKPSSVPRDWEWGNREFAIKDPDGYRIVFYQPI